MGCFGVKMGHKKIKTVWAYEGFAGDNVNHKVAAIVHVTKKRAAGTAGGFMLRETKL